MPLMTDVFEEHLDEASWLWTRWERALMAPDYDLAETAELEERLLAHLDGLVEGGAPVAESLLRPALESEERSRVCAAAFVLLAEAAPEDIHAWVRGAGPGQRAAVQRALELCGQEQLGAVLSPLLASGDAQVQATVLEALVFRGAVQDSMLSDLLSNEDARVRIAALRGLRELPRSAPPKLLSHALASAHPGIRDAAIELGLALGAHEAWEACRKALETGDAHAREPMVLWALGCEEAELGRLIAMLRRPERRTQALWALGFSGRAAAAEACLEWMGDEDRDVARLAGEAFSAISGLRLEGVYALPPEEPPEEPLPLEQEDLDADLVHRPEDDLPWPAAEPVARWWHEAKGNFAPGTRYLMGHPFQAEALIAALEQGPMRRRHVLARELALRSRRTLFVPTRALTGRQRVALARVKAAAPHFRRPAWR
ncbi:TIGR02270 family protein [Corallococcus sp. CA053C]|uniref:TIGR02270 family protein n=1 Tax=Corallococcus sp. CA053C TaxID=2316732 RepID=UPI000EA15624|nr:TIGR02270 family protein [Corallococcus sp. CA053C]RKG99958.1 TIGR02270 family protein [Corallococcus sp. CA053C]